MKTICLNEHMAAQKCAKLEREFENYGVAGGEIAKTQVLWTGAPQPPSLPD